MRLELRPPVSGVPKVTCQSLFVVLGEEQVIASDRIHPRLTMSSADQLPALFGELERFVSQAEYDKALKMCDKILGIASDDQDALHCKLITLIRLEKYSDALALLSRKFKGENKFLFERAYCLYRSNQFAQALDVIETAKKSGQQDVATRHLEAQLVRHFV
jgi:signal recognition particle subunit SRP72